MHEPIEVSIYQRTKVKRMVSRIAHASSEGNEPFVLAISSKYSNGTYGEVTSVAQYVGRRLSVELNRPAARRIAEKFAIPEDALFCDDQGNEGTLHEFIVPNTDLSETRGHQCAITQAEMLALLMCAIGERVYLSASHLGAGYLERIDPAPRRIG